MSTSGTYITDPNLAEFFDEAFERAGIKPAAITAEHIASARRSMRFVLSKWANKGPRQWQFPDPFEYTVTQGDTTFDLPYGLIDVTTVTLVRDDRETEMLPMSRSDYRTLHNKTLQGRPTTYFVDRRRGTQETPTGVPVRMFFWLAAENSTDIIRVTYYRQTEDPAASGMTGTMDLPFRWHEAMAAALAARIAQKFNPVRYAELKDDAREEFMDADREDTERAPLIVSVSYSPRRYGRR